MCTNESCCHLLSAATVTERQNVLPNCWLNPAWFQCRLISQLLGLTQRLVLYGQNSLNTIFSSASIALLNGGLGLGCISSEKTLAVQHAEPLYISIHTDWYLAWCCSAKLHRKSDTWITSKQSCSLLMQTILKAKAKQHLAARPLPLRRLPANLKVISEVPNWLLCLGFFPVH